MKKIINSKNFTWFRRSFLEKIRRDIENKKSNYCCNVRSWHRIFICWKDLKEVQDNRDSLMLLDFYFSCNRAWFENRYNRIKFLDECIEKTKANGYTR